MEALDKIILEPLVTIVLSTYYDENSIADPCYSVIEQMFSVLDHISRVYPGTQFAVLRCPSSMCSSMNNSGSYVTLDYYQSGAHKNMLREGRQLENYLNAVKELRTSSDTTF